MASFLGYGLLFVITFALAPLLTIWGFNTFVEQGNWDLAQMPHNVWTYLAVWCFGGLIKVK